MQNWSEGNIPTDIQEYLQLDTLKKRVVRVLRRNLDAQNFFNKLSPTEIYELMPDAKKYRLQNVGYLFERVAEAESNKERQTSAQVIKLKTSIRQLMYSDLFRKYVGVGNFGDPDFPEIDDDFKIVNICECKLSKGSVDWSANQPERATKTYIKLIELLQDNNPPAELAMYISEILQSSNHRLSISPECEYTFIFPKVSVTQDRVESYRQRGYKVRFSSISKDDAINIHNHMREVLGNRR